ncbi:sigma-54 interaction domain-containing protein [Bacillus sp. M6-12]|uniref:sigma-54 interaction domain-containing protein n=1 Tax=Bacillus sp. M6-12 TaxID=2054166 RepID=UPI0026C74EB3
MPEKSLNITNEVLEAILKSIDEGIHVIDLQGKTIFYNEVAARLDGMKIAEVLGKPLLEVFPSLTRKTSTLLQVIDRGKPIYHESQSYLNLHGEKAETMNTTLPIYVKGKLIGAVEIAKDYSRLRMLSERLLDLESKVKRKEKPKSSNNGAIYTFDSIITNDPVFRTVISRGRKAGKTSSPVLVYGESGVGKELFVQGIHNESYRRKGPFIAQNCAALPESLLESLLFGTAKGSYTGALERPGLFELANGGTLFLDELNSMPVELQAKLLRVLEDGQVRRVGGAVSIPVDVRVIAAMNIMPEQALEEKIIRSDLFFRLNVLRYELPPLRNRKKDILLLTEHFISMFNTNLNLNIQGIDEQVSAVFVRYNWPGNVRELKHTIEYMMNVCEADVLTAIELPGSFSGAGKKAGADKVFPSLRKALRDAEVELINKALLQTSGNILQSAKLLGIPRQTLQYKLAKHGMEGDSHYILDSNSKN